MAPSRAHTPDIKVDKFAVVLVLIFCVALQLELASSTGVTCENVTVPADNGTNTTVVEYESFNWHYVGATYFPPSNSTFEVGMTVVSANDSIGGSCNFTITVVEPVAICPQPIVHGTDLGLLTANVSWQYPSGNLLDVFPLASVPGNGSTFGLGETIVSVSVVDRPQVYCNFTVTVRDMEPPTLVCPNMIMQVNNSMVAYWQVPTATDNSGEVTLLSSHFVGDYFPIGNTTVNYTAIDKYGLESPCSFVVEVLSDGSPEISGCPPDQTMTADAGVTSLPATWTPPMATDPDGGNVTRTSDFNPGDSFGVGTTRVTYTFTDDQGEESQCFFLIRISGGPDTTAPNAMCPMDFTVGVPPGTTERTVTWPEPTFNDAVDGNNLIVSQTKRSGSTFREGMTQVLYIAMDRSYNPVECRFTVTVNVTEDNEDPVFNTCPSNFTQWVAMGTTQVNVTWNQPNVTDNFDNVGIPTVVASIEPGSTFSLGDTFVNYTATDVVGNTATCEFFVTVREDTEAPVITGCPMDIVRYVRADVTRETVTWMLPNATDNSGSFTSISTPPSGTDFEASINGQNDQVIIRVSDDFGNTANCTFRVNVIIDTVPVINCPATVSRDNIQGQPYANVSWTEVTVTDDLTPVSQLQNTTTHDQPLQVFYDSPVSVTYTVTDERGNMATCTFEVRVNDVEAPTWLNCPMNMTRAATPGINTAIISWTAPTVTDNSGVAPTITNTAPSSNQIFSSGTTAIVYTAVDRSNNEGRCEFFITVTVDARVPEYDNCPMGQTLTFHTTAGDSTGVVTWPAVTATDDTNANVTITSNFNPEQVLAIGTYQVEYEARDSTGNVGFCRFTVNVIDSERPSFTSCPNDITVNVLASKQNVRVTWTAPTANDNSGSVTVTPTSGSRTPGSRFPQGAQNVVYQATDPSGNSVQTCSFVVNVQVKQDSNTVVLRGSLILDTVRGFDGVFGDITRQDNLEDDLDDLFRGTSLSSDFVGIQIPSSSFNSDNNFVIEYTLHLCSPAHYNEEDIRQSFNSGLSNNAFATANAIVPGSFDLSVNEFRGQFVLFSILGPSGTSEVIFQDCCADTSSNAYQNLLTRIYTHLDGTFDGLDRFRMSRILFLFDGSVGVRYTLTFDDTSTANANVVESTFNASVGTNNELTDNGASTNLYLRPGGVTAGNVEEICPGTTYCQNGGTCSITNATSYQFGCSCAPGFSGSQCQSEAGRLSTEAIIGIVVGVVGFLLLLLLLACCCCCCFVLAGGKDVERDSVYGRRRQQAPLILMPRDEYIYDNKPPPPRQGPIITEVLEEVRVDGPSFYHEDPDYVPPARFQPAPLAYGQRLRAILPGRSSYPPPPDNVGPRFHSDGIPADYGRQAFPPPPPESLGPRFHSETIPEPVGDMKRRLFNEFNY